MGEKKKNNPCFGSSSKLEHYKTYVGIFSRDGKGKILSSIRPAQKCWESPKERHWPIALCAAAVQIRWDKWRFSHEEGAQILNKATLVSNTCAPFLPENKFFESDKVEILQILRRDSSLMCLTLASCGNWHILCGLQDLPSAAGAGECKQRASAAATRSPGS